MGERDWVFTSRYRSAFTWPFETVTTEYCSRSTSAQKSLIFFLYCYWVSHVTMSKIKPAICSADDQTYSDESSENEEMAPKPALKYTKKAESPVSNLVSKNGKVVGSQVTKTKRVQESVKNTWTGFEGKKICSVTKLFWRQNVRCTELVVKFSLILFSISVWYFLVLKSNHLFSFCILSYSFKMKLKRAV